MGHPLVLVVDIHTRTQLHFHSKHPFQLLLTLMDHRWLGQNSHQSKLQRALGDVQAKMRMKVSGDKSEIRRHYIPALAPHLVDPLANKELSKDVGIYFK